MTLRFFAETIIEADDEFACPDMKQNAKQLKEYLKGTPHPQSWVEEVADAPAGLHVHVVNPAFLTVISDLVVISSLNFLQLRVPN